jgi:inorganic pyrophosphatase
VLIEVFIENEAGRPAKNVYDEKTLRFINTVAVSRPYPHPYGFIVGTTAEDGDNIDCFVLTATPLARGQRVTCRPIALMEQFEDGQVDHNVIAVPEGQEGTLTDQTTEALREFVSHVFDHVPGKHIRVGEFLDADAAIAHVDLHRE